MTLPTTLSGAITLAVVAAGLLLLLPLAGVVADLRAGVTRTRPRRRPRPRAEARPRRVLGTTPDPDHRVRVRSPRGRGPAPQPGVRAPTSIR